MAFEIQLFDVGTQTAGADLRTHQYKPVKLNASGQWVLTSVAGEPFGGILQNNPNTGEIARVRILGVSKAEMGAATTLGGRFMASAAGAIIDAATAGSKTGGFILEGTSGAGRGTVLLLGSQSGNV
jgi:hypothetical protein